ncbi:hypothetical protein [Nesterenkonia rhizosphaerae]|uniref:hypothetical protein n=1 Tax=Nesterenkonia rhizosphaerae TaxID=1348272 RepID=UPI0031EC7C64
MSKTGGGIGTNQHKIEGTSRARQSAGISGESSITLGETLTAGDQRGNSLRAD